MKILNAVQSALTGICSIDSLEIELKGKLQQ
jgi:hypothetical protein